MTKASRIGREARRHLRALGPGVITGAADDDPSGIATYSVAGARFGTDFLWTALLTWPLMAVVQMTCARIGMVTGEGLAGALRRKLPRSLVVLSSVALLVANSINIGADLSGMGDAAGMLSGVRAEIWVPVFGVAIAAATARFRYHQIAAVLKWLALSLFAYVLTAFLVHPRWSAVWRATLLPSLPRGREAWAILVGLLGTTISPYLFYWQASQEVEEEKALGRRLLVRRQGATPTEIRDRWVDVGVGTFFSNLVMFFIILTTALTLHAHGRVDIESSRQAAAALEPLAGHLAATLFTIGILGVGLLAIPTLAGSAAYAFAETFHWREGLDERLASARRFYGVVFASTAVGMALDLARVNPIRALYWTAILNGVLAPFLLVGILLVASDRELMRGQESPRWERLVVALTALLMFAAALALLVV